jgi:myo-inositol 2-dehydrogenase / D-chiro-inositol 1-dehydrogenase
MSDQKSNRREFLKTSGIVAAGSVLPYTWTSSQAKAEDKNSRLGVGSIGLGYRGIPIGHQASQLGNMVACCDVDSNRAKGYAAGFRGKCKLYGDFREVLARKDVDVVTIATPDHWHAGIAIAAMKAGKDVYCEKPLSLTIDEGKQICRVVKETKRVFQVGTQQRSEFGSLFLKAVAIARSGRLGQNLKATVSIGGVQPGGPFKEEKPPAHLDWNMWLGPAARVPYIKERTHHFFRNWLEYSGGQVTDWGVHHTDIAMWALGLENTGPVQIQGVGKFDKRKNHYNVATSFRCTMTFATGATILLKSGGSGVLIEGEKGRISVNRGRLTGKPVIEIDKSPALKKQLADDVVELYQGKQPGSHMRNFFDSVKSRKLPISDVFTHHRSVSACHLCNIAMRLQRTLKWDPKKEDFINDAEATAMLSRPQRKGFTIAELAR